MSYQPCTCCRPMEADSGRRANFYKEHFIPRSWGLHYYSKLSGDARLILKGYCRDCHGDLEEIIPTPDGLAGDDLLKGIYDAMQSAHPYASFAEGIGYYGGREERNAFYRQRDKRSQFARNKAFLDLFHDYDRAQVRSWLERTFPPQSPSEVLRDTAGDLFCTTVRMARAAGDFDKADGILDYILPREDEADSPEGIKLTADEFDFVPVVSFGSSEGIYVDCYLKGKFDESGRHSLHIGTLKTLAASLDACKIMGEVCGALMFHASAYVNANIHRYTPDAHLKALEGRS